MADGLVYLVWCVGDGFSGRADDVPWIYVICSSETEAQRVVSDLHEAMAERAAVAARQSARIDELCAAGMEARDAELLAAAEVGAVSWALLKRCYIEARRLDGPWHEHPVRGQPSLQAEALERVARWLRTS